MRLLIILTLVLTTLLGCKKEVKDGRDLSWTVFQVPLTEPVDIEFTSTNVGYISGTEWGGYEPNARIYKTTDGGDNWKLLYSVGYGAGSEGGRLLFTSMFNGVFAHYYLGYNISHTTDNGQTWNKVNTQGLINVNVGFKLDSTNLFIGNLRSTDGGQNWTYYNFPGNLYSEISDYLYTDTLSGYLTTTTGLVLKTTDLWMSWDTIYNNAQKSFSTIEMVDSNKILVGGSDMLLSTDSGQNWSTIYSDHYVNDIEFVDSQIAFAVCRPQYSTVLGYGIVLKSIDGGLTWSINTHKRELHLTKLEVVDSQTIIALSSTGAILKTTTQGN